MTKSGPKRRKVRKGTRSCWECRRRKIACKYLPEDNTSCINCQGRPVTCLSQEHDPEDTALSPSPETKARDDVVGQRLIRLENMMNQLSESNKSSQVTSEDTYHKDTALDLLDESAVANAHGITTGAGFPTLEVPAHTPADNSAASTRAGRYSKIAKLLHALLPSKKLRQILACESPGALMAVNGFHTHAEVLAGKAEPVSSLADDTFPAATSHPTIIAKRLLQYNLCLQLLPQSRLATIDLGGQLPCQLMYSWVSAAVGMVTSVDDLVGSLQGLECLLLQVWFLGDAGHLRKAWMASRRALGMAQLMGLHRLRPAVRSIASPYPPNPNVLWYKINCCDRYQSLTLGLPPGSRNNSFTYERFEEGDDALDKMGKQYAVLCSRISERQEMYDLYSPESYAATQAIDADMEANSRVVPDYWWTIKDVNSATGKSPEQLMKEHTALSIQMRHYMLMILLHLPFIVRENGRRIHRYEYNRITCLHAARCILHRFLVFRKDYIVFIAGRQVDYAALIASIALCVGYLGVNGESGKESDVRLVQNTLERFKKMSAQMDDNLIRESSETIQQILGILKGNMDQDDVALAVPFLGTVNIGQRVGETNSSVPATSVSDTLMGSDKTVFEGFYGKADGGVDFSFTPLSLTFDSDIPMFQQDQRSGSLACQSNRETNLSGSSGYDLLGDSEDWALQEVDTSILPMFNQRIN